MKAQGLCHLPMDRRRKPLGRKGSNDAGGALGRRAHRGRAGRGRGAAEGKQQQRPVRRRQQHPARRQKRRARPIGCAEGAFHHLFCMRGGRRRRRGRGGMPARRTANLGQGRFQRQGRSTSVRHGDIVAYAECGVGQESDKRDCRYPDSEPEHKMSLSLQPQTSTAHPGRATPGPNRPNRRGGGHPVMDQTPLPWVGVTGAGRALACSA